MTILDAQQGIEEPLLPAIDAIRNEVSPATARLLFPDEERADAEGRGLIIQQFIDESRGEFREMAEDTLSSDFWQKLDHKEEVYHVITKHLTMVYVLRYGVPVFDIELFVALGFSLEPICKYIYGQLRHKQARPVYCEFLVKTLLFIEEKQPGVVDLKKVRAEYPNYEAVTFEFARDTLDVSFDAVRQEVEAAA